MSNNDWMLWNHESPKLAESAHKREPLLAMTHKQDHCYCVCELHHHGEYGVEAQFI